MTTVVSGRSGSGKTTLSLLLAEFHSLDYINVGDLLGEALKASGAAVTRRSDFGVEYLERFGLNAYADLLAEIAGPRVVLDGVRLIAGVRRLREVDRVLHFHREGPPSLVGEWQFEAELGALREDADITVPWMRSLSELRSAIGSLDRRSG